MSCGYTFETGYLKSLQICPIHCNADLQCFTMVYLPGQDPQRGTRVNKCCFFTLWSPHHSIPMHCLEASVLDYAKCTQMFRARTLSRSTVPVHISPVLELPLWQVFFTGAKTGKGILGERGYVNALTTTSVWTKKKKILAILFSSFSPRES